MKTINSNYALLECDLMDTHFLVTHRIQSDTMASVRNMAEAWTADKERYFESVGFHIIMQSSDVWVAFCFAAGGNQ